MRRQNSFAAMILSIDKTKELTRKEYVDFLQKTKGESISEARISQLVSAGRLKVRDYPELNNLQLIVLDDDEQALAQARFTTSQALHTYSYKELGLMFGKLVHDLNNDNGNAQTLLSEKQTQLESLVTTLQQTETERNEARQTIEELTGKNQQLSASNEKLQADLTSEQARVEALQNDVVQLNETLTDVQRKLDVETSFRSEFEEFKALVITILQKQAEPTKGKTSDLVGESPSKGKRSKTTKD